MYKCTNYSRNTIQSGIGFTKLACKHMDPWAWLNIGETQEKFLYRISENIRDLID